MKPARLHTPVMLAECVQALRPALQARESVYVDATLGMGGHASAVLSAVPTTRLIGIDRDADALELARARLTEDGHEGRFHLVHATYDEMAQALTDAGVEKADGILMDLGLSSYQIDTRERGFSYSADAPLDMRMDASAHTPTAAELLNTLPHGQLARILSTFGEERYASAIASAVVRMRTTEPFERSHQLVQAIESAIPAKAKYAASHPAKRTFQALRIAVNEELSILDDALNAAMSVLHVGGRLVVESYHSLEDRMVKTAFAKASSSSAPPGLPVELEQFAPRFTLVTRGALQASAREIEANPRAASVRVRVLERVRPTENNES